MMLGELPLLGWIEQAVRFLFGRPRLRIRVFGDGDRTDVGSLTIEIENRGARPTSLDPDITVTYLILRGGKMRRETAAYAVREVDRLLAPFQARVFSASVVQRAPHYGFSWFRQYRIATATGHVGHAYVRHALLPSMTARRFYWERVRFRLFGHLDGNMPSSIEEFEAERRRLGPH